MRKEIKGKYSFACSSDGSVNKKKKTLFDSFKGENVNFLSGLFHSLPMKKKLFFGCFSKLRLPRLLVCMRAQFVLELQIHSVEREKHSSCAELSNTFYWFVIENQKNLTSALAIDVIDCCDYLCVCVFERIRLLVCLFFSCFARPRRPDTFFENVFVMLFRACNVCMSTIWFCR